MFEPLALVLHVVIGATLMGVGITVEARFHRSCFGVAT